MRMPTEPQKHVNPQRRARQGSQTGRPDLPATQSPRPVSHARTAKKVRTGTEPLRSIGSLVHREGRDQAPSTAAFLRGRHAGRPTLAGRRGRQCPVERLVLHLAMTPERPMQGIRSNQWVSKRSRATRTSLMCAPLQSMLTETGHALWRVAGFATITPLPKPPRLR